MHKLTDLQKKVIAQEKLSIPTSIDVLVEGFQRFQDRQFPSSLSGVSFIRIAGQAAALSDSESRDEVRGIINKIKPGGAFLVLGHGGTIECGAVKTKKKELELTERGESLNEHPSILQLLRSIPPSVRNMGSPEAETANAISQAERIYTDLEFAGMIKAKNITVVAGILDIEGKGNEMSVETRFTTVNREEWNDDKLFERHPKLYALRLQLRKGMGKAMRMGVDLQTQYAHGIFLYDPLMMRTVLDPLAPTLDVGGSSCVDARLQANTPDGFKYACGIMPNTVFGVSIGMKNGKVSFSADDEPSIRYALGHVKGVNSLAAHGETGNGHIIIADRDIEFSKAKLVRSALLARDGFDRATSDGKTITLTAFDGRQLRIMNEGHNIDITVDYQPKTEILCMP